MKILHTPITEEYIESLQVGDMIYISGKIFCGRDAVLPKICRLFEEADLGDIDLRGSVIFHTAVSPAGVGPTSSNKVEIEGSIPKLSEAGVKLHLGKGAINKDTVAKLNEFNSVYAIIPPVTALLGSKTISKRLVAFPELGMEAFYELEVEKYPCIIAAAHNKSIY
ncbi:MAG: fumarate hydratase [Clostridiales bacterium]|mgnify:CR=1 FL=1|jgi:fumarate hydratase subunit beta|nr:fumarate hydratase [Clostridiales bacterium]